MIKKDRYRLGIRPGDRNYVLEQVLLFIGSVTVAFVLLMLASCERRDLYVYGDEFKSVVLEVDWRKYADRNPDGMTAWFYPLDDLAKKPYRFTTANVNRHELYLSGGHYQGVVIDYSPEEFSRQEFLDLDSMRTARVQATPATYQPDSLTVAGEGVPAGLSREVNQELFGEAAWTSLQQPRPALRDTSGLYVVANQPEQMALDTLNDRLVDRGQYGDYIPWKERETYQSTIKLTNIQSVPETIVWKLRIRVWIKSGFNYLWETPGSITGLADGHFLPRDVITDNPCLLSIDGWELERSGENSGYIATTLNVWGLRPETLRPDRWLHGSLPDGHYPGMSYNATTRNTDRPDPGSDEWWDYFTLNCVPKDIRLNLAFTLRDHATTLYYHFNVGHYVVSWDNQLALRIDLGPDFFDPDNPDGAHGEGGDPDNPSPDIDLPFVEAYNGTGFGADVTPWVEEPPVDVPF